MIPDDLFGHRWVKAVSRIEVINLVRKPKAYLISMGCADPDLLTQKALSALGRADVFVCSDDLKKRLAAYIGGRPVLFDPFKYLMPEPIYGKELGKLSPKEKEALLEKKIVGSGETDSGGAATGEERGLAGIRGSLYLWESAPRSPPDWEIRKRSSSRGSAPSTPPTRSSGRNWPAGEGRLSFPPPGHLKDNPALLKAAVEKGDTLALFMGLKDLKGLVDLLGGYYPPSTPVYFAYRVGYADSERLVKTTLDKALSIAWEEKEKWLGMIYIGACLEAETLDRHH